MNEIRIGQGIDFHRLEVGLDLWIGGIKVPSEKGAVAHSDGDVLIHSICDAMLGAAGKRDIGYHFPDNNEKYLDIDSKLLLAETVSLVKEAGYSINNIDSTVCLESPRLSSFIEDMCNCMADICEIDRQRVSVKATTTEKMGFTGRGEGIVALASVLLIKNH